jgi:membrane-associated PAP2 superfamily phosphatase
MNRTGLLIALGIAAVVGLVFGLYPALDLKIAAPFFDPKGIGFWARVDPGFLWVRLIGTYTVTAIVAPAFLALAWKLIQPRRRMLIPGRAAVLMIATLALAPGLVTNVILKDYWGRPRPIDVAEFGGEEHFVPWWDPRGDCPKNCSFVAGEPSGAFWTLAPAALVPPPWRAFAYAGALAFGAVIGFGRIAAGGHFFSDVVFAGVFTFLVIWLVHGLLYRWRRTRITDGQVEGALERIAMPGYEALERLFARLSGRKSRTDERA